MELWCIYFFGKLALYFQGHIRFEFILNLLFALFLLLPLPQKLFARRFFTGLKFTLALCFAFLLFWHETWFPPLQRSIELLSETGGISPGYIASFLQDSFSLPAAGIFLLICVVCFFLNKRITLTPLVFAGIISVPLLAPKSAPVDIAAYLDNFYRSEAARVIPFGAPDEHGPDFDIIILNICSLSWDDLDAAGTKKDTFLRQFDLLFTNFNTVSSYTNPSAIRLLRANCGQRKHVEIYRETNNDCYLLESLRSHGYQTYAAIDNDAPSYRFVEDIMTFGRADKPIAFIDLPVMQYDFDRSSIYDDLSILNRWWDMRLRSASQKAALYMDITTLHGGAHWVSDPQWWKRDRKTMYDEFARHLFKNLQTFFRTLSESGKNSVVILVPEHGMALRGSSLQPADIREIPLPSITTVPVGVKFIGQGFPPTPEHQVIVTTPTSYLALSHLLSSFLAAPSFERESMLKEEIISRIPEVRFVAENETTLAVKKDSAVFYYGKEKEWKKLSQ